MMLNYAQIIVDFGKFSPESKIDDYIDYLKFKLNFSKDEKYYINWTMIKYASLLKRYLHTLYHREVPKIRIGYFKKPKNRIVI